MSENKKLTKNQKSGSSGGFRMLDLILALLIAAVLAAAIYAYLPGLLSSSGKKNTVEYTVEFRDIDRETASGFATGLPVWCDDLPFGTVKSVQIREYPPTYEIRYEGSSAIEVQIPQDHVISVIKVTADARVKDSEITVNGKVISAGLTYEIMLPTYCGEAVCTAVSAGGRG